MKKTLIFAVLLLLLSMGSALPAAPASSDNGRTAVRIYGGLSLMNGGDFNRGLGGWLDLWAHTGSLWGVETDRDGGPGGWGTTVGADVLFPLTSWLSFGMGAGLVRARGVSRSRAESNGGIVPDNQEIETSPRALPFRAGFFVSVPISERIDIGLHGGAAYYASARATAVYRRDWEGYWEEDRFDLKSSGLGYDGGVSVGLRLSRRISVFVEGQSRWARLAKFFGSLDRTSSEGGAESLEGTLYSLGYSLGDGEVFDIIDVLTQPPVGPAFTRAGEAVVDFSGFSLVVGLLLRI